MTRFTALHFSFSFILFFVLLPFFLNTKIDLFIWLKIEQRERPGGRERERERERENAPKQKKKNLVLDIQQL